MRSQGQDTRTLNQSEKRLSKTQLKSPGPTHLPCLSFSKRILEKFLLPPLPGVHALAGLRKWKQKRAMETAVAQLPAPFPLGPGHPGQW